MLTVGRKAEKRCWMYMKMLPFFAACYRDEADFFLRPWNDIFWEIRQCVENGVLKEEFAEDQDEEMKIVLKGTVSDNEEKMGRLTYQIMEQAVLKLFRKITEKHMEGSYCDGEEFLRCGGRQPCYCSN